MMIREPRWKSIPGLPGYEISEEGQVRVNAAKGTGLRGHDGRIKARFWRHLETENGPAYSKAVPEHRYTPFEIESCDGLFIRVQINGEKRTIYISDLMDRVFPHIDYPDTWPVVYPPPNSTATDRMDGRKKLTDKERLEIFNDKESTHVELSKKYDVAPSSIRRIRDGRDAFIRDHVLDTQAA